MQNLPELFADAALAHAGRVAIEIQREQDVESVTYGRLREMAGRTAAWLALIGVAPGDRCAILADNDARWCAAFLGVLRCGAVAVPLDTHYSADQVRTLLADCSPRVIFTSSRYLDTARQAVAGADASIRIVLLAGELPAPGSGPGAKDTVSFEGMVSARMPAPPLPACPATPADPAVILYTSGTTSDPKGVVLTHGNLMAERAAALSVVQVDERDSVLGVLPLFHALALVANLLLPLSIGARVVFLETLNTAELLRALTERGITVLACVPQFFYLIHQRVMTEVRRAPLPLRALFRMLLALNARLRRAGINAGRLFFPQVHARVGPRMRLMVTGGSRFDPTVGDALHALGFTILQAYGLTETSGAATLTRPGDRLDTVGLPLPGVEIRIAPRDDGGDGQDGEVLIRGPIVMQGYFNRRETVRVPDTGTEAGTLRDGWLHTGDLGRLDAQGRLTITGRSKEVIVLGSGKNVYPEDVEAVYARSPFIREICVVGLSRPGEPAADRLYAVVVPDAEALRARKITNVGELLRFEMEGASVHLPPHMRVLGYEIDHRPLPRTTTGKIRRFEVEQRLRAAAQQPPADIAETGIDREWLASDDVAPAVVELQRIKPGAAPRRDAHLELDLGLDSMERVELLTALEQRYRVRLPEERVQELHTFGEVVEALLATPGAADLQDAAQPWDVLLSPDGNRTPWAPWLQRRWLVPGTLLLAAKALFLLLRPAVRVQVSGLSHLPPHGPYLICPNHESYLDPLFLVPALPWRIARQLFSVGASEYFETPLMRWLSMQLNVVPVDPDASLVPAMQAGAAGLRDGRVLLLFPEGERSIDGTVRRFKKGAAILSRHLQAPVVPVSVEGVFPIWPRNRPFNWRALLPGAGTAVRIRIGEAMAPPAREGGETDGEFAARLREVVLALRAGAQCSAVVR